MSSSSDAASVFGHAIAEHLEVVRNMQAQQPQLEAIAHAMTASLRGGGKILWCGNGGSAGDSQHLAAELVGRYRRDRRGLASIALTTDSSALTAIANDHGYEAVFSRQVEALGRAACSARTESGDGRFHRRRRRQDGIARQSSLRCGFQGHCARAGGAHPRRTHALRLD